MSQSIDKYSFRPPKHSFTIRTHVAEALGLERRNDVKSVCLDPRTPSVTYVVCSASVRVDIQAAAAALSGSEHTGVLRAFQRRERDDAPTCPRCSRPHWPNQDCE